MERFQGGYTSFSIHKYVLFVRREIIIKIAVYTICRDEEKQVLGWLHNIREADFVFVGDTGSTDNSVSLLKKGGAAVFDLCI